MSVTDVYGALIDKVPFGAMMNKGPTIETGQTSVNRYSGERMQSIADGKIDPSFVIPYTVGREGRAVSHILTRPELR